MKRIPFSVIYSVIILKHPLSAASASVSNDLLHRQFKSQEGKFKDNYTQTVSHKLYIGVQFDSMF